MRAAPSPQLVQSAAAAIYLAWLPLIGEVEAREQAQAFASRFHIIDGPVCPLPADERTDYPDDDDVQSANHRVPETV